VSTIGINPHTSKDAALLESIAQTTGGRYYEPLDGSQLPSIFIKEAKTLKRSMIQNKTFSPRIEFPSPVLKGIDLMPDLLGYVLTSAKPRSHTILRGPEDEEINPVLSIWRYGTGSAAAFTSDLSPNWGGGWVGWGKYRAFVGQLLTEISRAQEDSELHLQVTAAGSLGVITVEDHHEEASFLEMQARVVGPDDREETLSLDQVAPRRYRATFPLWGTGRYQVMAAGVGSNRSDKAVSSLAVAYSPECLQLHSNAKVLNMIAKRMGGRILNGKETALFDFERVTKESSRSVIDWVLVLLACLIPLDVGLRRVQIDPSVVKGWFSIKKVTESGETMSALLKRKSAVGSQMARPLESPVRSEDPKTKPKPVDPEETAAVPKLGEVDDASLSTTERLLARKRKCEEEGDR
jgi:hypothetical protein